MLSEFPNNHFDSISEQLSFCSVVAVKQRYSIVRFAHSGTLGSSDTFTCTLSGLLRLLRSGTFIFSRLLGLLTSDTLPYTLSGLLWTIEFGHVYTFWSFRTIEFGYFYM